MNPFTLTALLFLLNFVQAFSQYESLEQRLDSLQKRSEINGFGVALFDEDSVFFQKGFGYLSAKSEKPYTIHTRQKIASISKLILGVAVLKAKELGLLHLEDDVNKYLPFSLKNRHSQNSTITIRHLATHTGGLAALPKYDLKAIYAPTKIKEEQPFGVKKWILNKYIKIINSNAEILLPQFLANLYHEDGKWYSKKNFLTIKPGQKVTYSNAGACLLALVIENASGIPYAEFVKQYITDLLGIENSFFDFEDNKTSLLQSTYKHAGVIIPSDFRLLLYPAGGFESSVSDFTKLMQAMLTKDVLLSGESIQEMLTTQFSTNYGILWELHSNGFVGHRGDILGVSSFAYYHRDQKMGYILFCNSAGTKPTDKQTEAIRKLLKDQFKRVSNEE